MAQQQINGTQILIGKPDDGSYGVTPSNINVPGVLSTDNLPSAIDKLIGIIDKLAPAKSPGLSTKYLSPQGVFGPYTARHAGTNSVWNGGYSATVSSTGGSLYTSIYTTPNPVVNVSDTSAAQGGLATFSDGQTGVLVASVDGNIVGLRALEGTYYGPGVGGSPDVNTWNSSGSSGAGGGLTITFDQDPYSVAPNTGFWTSLKATMSSTYSFPLDGNEHYYNMQHTTTGNVNKFKFIYDVNTTTSAYNAGYGSVPAVSGVTFSISLTLFTQSSTRWTSGVPSLSVGDYIAASYSIPNSGGLVSRFYNSTRITVFRMTPGGAGSPVSINDTNVSGIPLNGVPRAYQNPYRVSGITAAVASNMYSLNGGAYDTLFTIPVYNPMGTSVTDIIAGIYFGPVNAHGAASSRTLYIDTVSNETTQRVRSGDGQYPAFGAGTYDYGATYTTTLSQLSINDSSTYPQVCGELMLQNGIFLSPVGNYTNNYPVVGPNYVTTINNNGANAFKIDPGTPGTYSRWATFNAGSISGKSAFIVQINTPINITSNGIAPHVTTPNTFAIYVTVPGSTGWLDLNKIWYSGNPTTNGDGCYDNTYVGKSATVRRATLGTNVFSGNVYVRIGLPEKSTITFTGVTLTS